MLSVLELLKENIELEKKDLNQLNKIHKHIGLKSLEKSDIRETQLLILQIEKKFRKKRPKREVEILSKIIDLIDFIFSEILIKSCKAMKKYKGYSCSLTKIEICWMIQRYRIYLKLKPFSLFLILLHTFSGCNY